MRSIILTIARELKLIFRDGITIYLAISPALLALVYLVVFGSIQATSISLAADKDLPKEMAVKLEAVAEVEYTQDMESLRRRVNGADSIAGVYMQNGKVMLLVEGNEAEEFAESRRALVNAALKADLIGKPGYGTETVHRQGASASGILMACIFLLALFIGGATLGLGGVSERESGIIRAISISPMAVWGYIISKIIPALLFGVVGVSACAVLMGMSDVLLQFVLLTLCSTFVIAIIIFLIIAFADNQIAAVGVLKIVMPLFLVLGVLGAFIPEKWLVFLYALPMYWQYVAIDAIRTGGDSGFSLLMLLATSIPWSVVLMVVFANKTKMRIWR